MSSSAALVPIPFYPPARSGSGSFFRFGMGERRPLLIERRQRSAAVEAEQALAYNREGCLTVDWHIGRLLDIYA
jgi:hypothetical protein